MNKLGKAKPGTRLWWIGLWATIWLAVTGLYVVLLVWVFGVATDRPVAALVTLAGLILVGWLLGALFWLKELQRKKISYKVAFKDLFLTIRR